MAWNGKNVSILGSKPTEGIMHVVSPSSTTSQSVPSNADTAQSLDSKKNSIPPSLSSSTNTGPNNTTNKPLSKPVVKNVWNGRNTKIMGGQVKTATTQAATANTHPVTSVAVENIPIRSSTPATDCASSTTGCGSSTTSSITKNSATTNTNNTATAANGSSNNNKSKAATASSGSGEGGLTANNKDGSITTETIDSTVVVDSVSNGAGVEEGEDEETSSSSSPKSVVLEGNVVTTTTVVNTNNKGTTTTSNESQSKKKKNKNNKSGINNKDNNTLEDKNGRTSVKGSNNNNNNRYQQPNNKNSQNVVVNKNKKQHGNNNKQQQQKGNHGKNNNNNNASSSSSLSLGNNNKQETRGNGSGSGNGRRKFNGDKSQQQLCVFYAQGKCRNGTSCTFKHELPSASSSPTSSSNNHINKNNYNNNSSTNKAMMMSGGGGRGPTSFNNNTSKDFNNNVSNKTLNNNKNKGSGTTFNASATSSYVPHHPTKRVYDPYKAKAIKLAKDAQDLEDRSKFASTTTSSSSTAVVSSNTATTAATSKIIQEGEAKVGEEEKKAEDKDCSLSLQSSSPPVFSIDVECIATGYGSCAKGINDGCGNVIDGTTTNNLPSSSNNQYNERSHRYPGRVAMVDTNGHVLADLIIRPPMNGKGVTSYLTPLTGLTSEVCLGPNAISLTDAITQIKKLLPTNGILVGQAIDHDVEWLGLVPGVDFGSMLDISDIFRQRMPSNLNVASEVVKKKDEEGYYNQQPSPSSSSSSGGTVVDMSSDEYLGFATRYRHFSLRHVCLNLLGEDIQSGVHNPITDAQYSLTLFHKYRNSSVTQLRIVRDGLHRAPITPGFAAENTPVIDGVCVSAAGYHYKRAGRKILRWYQSMKEKN